MDSCPEKQLMMKDDSECLRDSFCDVGRLEESGEEFNLNDDLSVYDLESSAVTEVQGWDDDIPVAMAVLSEPLIEPSSLHNRVRLGSASMVECGLAYTRAKFLFARVLKPEGQTIGLILKDTEGGVIISRIHAHGAFAKSNIRAGDHIVSVNGKPCSKVNAEKVARYIAKSSDTVALVVHNKMGDPDMVSTYIQKRSFDEKAGITLRRKRGATYISCLEDKGLFVGTLVTPGQRCMFLNEISCDSLPLRTAANLIRSTTEHVTLVTRPRCETAMVLSCESDKCAFWKNLALGRMGAAKHILL
jgi:hypothetical protein